LKKYSGAEKAQVNLRTNQGRLLLSVCDEGSGFDAKEKRNTWGLGIRSMGERARLVGGQCEIHSEPGHGTREPGVGDRIPKSKVLCFDGVAACIEVNWSQICQEGSTFHD